jgi:hypothetical protein
MLTPKHKEITSNKLETTDVHSSGGELKIPMSRELACHPEAL